MSFGRLSMHKTSCDSRNAARVNYFSQSLLVRHIAIYINPSQSAYTNALAKNHKTISMSRILRTTTATLTTTTTSTATATTTILLLSLLSTKVY